MKHKKDEIPSVLGRAKGLLLIGSLVIIFMPFLLTRKFICEEFDFSETGQIGDTIGGITAPFMTLIGSFLVFFALKAQVTANELIQKQIDKDNEEKAEESEEQNLNKLYSYLIDSINSFNFMTLPKEQLKNLENIETNIEYKGGAAFYHLFSQIRCHYHGSQEQLNENQAVSELLSVLKIMNLLLDKLSISKINNKEILITLIHHIFNYKITARIRHEEEEWWELKFCDTCLCKHGLPNDLKNLIVEIKLKLHNFQHTLKNTN